jgi:chemotaxis protein CheX
MSTVELPRVVDLVDVVTEVWSSMLSAESRVELVDPRPLLTDRAAEPSTWSAVVDVAGPAPRRVSVVTDDACARALTRHLLRVSAPADDDVADALGELANIVGGNLKSLMPPPSALSLPSTARGVPAYDASLPVSAVEATWNDRPVLVTVHDTHPQGDLS